MEANAVRDESDLAQQEIASEETNSTEVITEPEDDIKRHEAAEEEREVKGSTEEEIKEDEKEDEKPAHASESGQAPAEGEDQEPEQQPSEEAPTDVTEAAATTEAISSETRVNPLFKHQRLEGLMAKRPKAEALQQQGVPVEVRTRDRSMTMEALNFFFGGRASRAVVESQSRMAARSQTTAPRPVLRDISSSPARQDVLAKGKEKEADYQVEAVPDEAPTPAEEQTASSEPSSSIGAESRDATRDAQSTERKRLLIITVGSRGDVQPYLALAIAMIAAGWDVSIATHGNFQHFVEENSKDVQFISLHGDPSAVLNSPQFVHAFYEGGMMEQMRVMSDESKTWVKSNFYRIWAAARQFAPDLILTGVTTLSEVLAVGQKLRTPVVVGCTTPFYPTNEFPPVTALPDPLPLGFLNSFVHWAAFKTIWAFAKEDINHFRESLNLGPQGSYAFDAAPVLCMYSETLVPRPKDWPMDMVEITGFWDLKQRVEYEPPTELETFLNAGAPPIYMGFGSTPLQHAVDVAVDFCKVTKRLKRRGVIQIASSEDYEQVAQVVSKHDHVYLLSEIPHQWLFPRCSLIIHHGGAGTTATALRAGVPNIIYPLLADQPFWASRVAELGVSPIEVIPLRELSRVNLEAQILEASSEVTLKRARDVADVMRDEPDGVANAVAWLERYAASRFHPRNYGARTPATEDGLFAWVPDEETTSCTSCSTPFTFFNRRHHCRLCGSIFCGNCVSRQRGLLNYPRPQSLPVCHQCNPYVPH